MKFPKTSTAVFGILIAIALTGQVRAADTSTKALLNDLRSVMASHQDLPRVLKQNIVNAAVEGDTQSLQRLSYWLNRFVDDPSTFGTVSYDSPFLVVGSVVNITGTVTPGTAIQSGGGILVSSHWQQPIAFQTDNPNAENYLQLRRADGSLLTPGWVNQRGIYGGLQSLKAVPFFQTSSGSLEAGEVLSLEFRNLRLPKKAGALLLSVQFSVEDKKGFVPMISRDLPLAAGPVEQIDVVAPSRVAPGAPVVATLHQFDRFGNAATLQAPGYDLLVDGVFKDRIEAGVTSDIELPTIQFSQTGVHNIEVRSGGGGIRSKANPIMVQSGTRSIQWGDLHRHSNQGEGVSAFAPLVSDDLAFDVNAVHQSFLTSELWRNIPPPKAWVFDSPLRAGGSLLVVGDWNGQQLGGIKQIQRQIDTSGFSVALPFNPVDDRSLNADHLSLVEIASGESGYEWFANRLLNRGFRVGFSASGHSHVLPIASQSNQPSMPAHPLTAALLQANESWQQAVKQGHTYATSGNRPVIQMTLNGAQPGSRISMSDRRTISGWVQGTGPLKKIELIKNGDVIKTLEIAAVGSDSQADAITGTTASTAHTLQVSFFSSSEPYQGKRDYPRNGREWLGFLRSSDTGLENIAAPGFRNPNREAITSNGSNRVDFITWTHGAVSSFMVDLAMLNEDTVLELNLSAGHEDVDFLPLYRPSSAFAGSRQMLTVLDLTAGPVTRLIDVDGYEDKVTFELVNKRASEYAEFNFDDQANPQPGDYYYVRIQQLDDYVAWTSPIFVGGFDAP